MPRQVWLLPGILGTTIDRLIGPIRLNVYPNPVALAQYGFAGLRLNAAGTGEAYPLLQGDLRPGVPMPLFYDDLVARLEDYSFVPILPKLDWRYSLITQASALSQTIIAADIDEAIALVCHSMGGLVAALAYANLLAAGQESRVHRIVTLATPWWGSYGALWPMMRLGLTYRLMRDLIGGIRAMRLQWPGIYHDVDVPACSWVTLYEMLPSLQQPSPDDPLRAQLYTPGTLSSVQTAINPTLLAAAGPVQVQLSVSSPPAAKHVQVRGSGYQTPQRWYGGPLSDYSSYGYGDGDGTVSLGMGTLEGRPYAQVPAAHDAIAYNHTVLANLPAWIETGLSQTIIYQ